MEENKGSLQSKIKKYLDEKEASKNFKDTENRVKFTRKELAAYKVIQFRDLEKLEEDSKVAEEFITKAKLFPDFDVDVEIENGVSSGTLFLKKQIRRDTPDLPSIIKKIDKSKEIARKKYYSYSLSPSEKFLEDYPEKARLVYWLYVTDLKESLISVRSLKDLAILYEAINFKIKNVYPAFVFDDELIEKYFNKEDDTYNVLVNELANKEFDNIWLLDDQETNNELIKLGIDPYISDNDDDDDDDDNSDNKQILKGIKYFFSYLQIKSFQNVKYTRYDDKPYSIVIWDKETTDLFIDKEEVTEHESILLMSKFAGDYLFKIIRIKPVLKMFFLREDNSKLSEEEVKKNYLQGLFSPEFMDMTKYLGYSYDPYFWTGRYPGLKKGDFLGIDQLRSGINNEEDKKKFFWMQLNSRYNELIETENKYSELKEKFKPHPENWDWTERKGKGSGEKMKFDEVRINTGDKLTFIQRTGGYQIDSENLKPENFESFFNNTLGIDRVTFGNYLPDEERSYHVKMFSGALTDLCDILNINMKAFTKFLGVTFAAQGRGGRAAATFITMNNSINLTRKRGDGTVAHELGHYFDYNFFGSGFGSEKSLDRAYKNRKGHWYLKDQDDLSMEALNHDLMFYITKGSEKSLPSFISENARIEYSKRTEAEMKGDLKRIVKVYANKAYYDKWSYGLDKKLNNEWKGLTLDEIVKLSIYNGEDSADFRDFSSTERISYQELSGICYHFKVPIYKVVTKLEGRSFSSVLGGGTNFYWNAKNMKSDYWVKNAELFARSFDTYVFWKLQEKGRFNNYLVSPNKFEYNGENYPQDVELEVIKEIYDKIFDIFRLNYGAFEPFTTEREDTFIELNEQDEVEDELTVEQGDEEETGRRKRATDRMTETIEEKLKGLLTLLKKA